MNCSMGVGKVDLEQAVTSEYIRKLLIRYILKIYYQQQTIAWAVYYYIHMLVNCV